MKIILTILVVLAVLAITILVNLKETKNMTKVNLDNSLIVDVRTKEEFEAGHSPKSINIPLSQIEAGEVDAFRNTDKEKIVLVCRSGGRAGVALDLLKKYGITKEVQNLGPWQNLEQ